MIVDNIKEALTKIRTMKPVIVNLTNNVTMDFMANVLLAVGAAPIMTSSQEELEELITMAGAVNINIGTLDQDFINRCELAKKIAISKDKPVILDPVGAGATRIRTNTSKNLLPNIAIVRGNASEILSLVDTDIKTMGVESAHKTDDAKQAAITIARTYNCVVVVSGASDFITDGIKEKTISSGSARMQLVTGMGCTLTAVIATFAAVLNDHFAAGLLATSYFGFCGSLAAQKTAYSGSFRTAFIDELNAANFSEFEQLDV